MTDTCIVCGATIGQGHSIYIDNDGNDVMHVGMCCLSHNHEEIKNSGIEKAILLMNERLNALTTLVRKNVKISGNE